MAESQSMTTAEVVAKTLIDEHADFLRDAVALVAAELMEAEIAPRSAPARARSREPVDPPKRLPPRPWATRVGEIELLVPRKRRARAYFPSFLEPRRRSEQALARRGHGGLRQRGLDPQGRPPGRGARHPWMSKDQVSADLRGARRAGARRFATAPLEGAYPYLWLDAKHLKVRDRGHVHSKALVVAYAVHESGRREVIGIDIGESETEAFWVDFLRALAARGLAGVRLAVSDDHDGLKAAIARVLGCPWQRCTVHFVRNMHGHCRRPARHGLRRPARGLQRRGPRAGQARSATVHRALPRRPLPKVAELLEAAEEDLLAFYRFPAAHWSKLRSTNPLERLNKEIGRRSDVVGIFPNDASAIRLVGAMLIEQNDEWLVCPALPLRGIARPGPRGPGRSKNGGGGATQAG